MAYHSITIGERNTWDDWRLLPSSRPYVAPPEPKTNYIEIDGMDGSLDYTNFLGPTKYKMRTGTWEFIVVNEDRDGFRPADWATRYSGIMNYIQEHRTYIRLEDDPGYLYYGRVRVSGWDSGENWSTITFEYNLEPYKYPYGGGTSTLDWNWDSLNESSTIYYGTFDVVGQKWRNLINPTPHTIMPVFECSSDMQVAFAAGGGVVIPTGRSQLITIYPGDNYMVFIGTGRVMIDYKIGISL